ncbi:hypothetical protein KIN20_019509 [Parelaphostrongylus tenuis]|uniref:Uncharacterized protein n=1 Tax=Parelaphostrongylus tenuis TaxID=148309 RepID=A0AAD5N375_PARTN|nr:hypothetical protein KIN20_019509 [Parelaphostrongylus tenuis]
MVNHRGVVPARTNDERHYNFFAIRLYPFGLQALFRDILKSVPNRHWITIKFVSQHPATHRCIFLNSIVGCLANGLSWTSLSWLVGQLVSFFTECLEPIAELYRRRIFRHHTSCRFVDEPQKG